MIKESPLVNYWNYSAHALPSTSPSSGPHAHPGKGLWPDRGNGRFKDVKAVAAAPRQRCNNPVGHSNPVGHCLVLHIAAA